MFGKNDGTDTKSEGSKGSFKRQGAKFRHQISQQAKAEFPAEANRYHLYVSLACPWAHRTLIMRKQKKLEHVISYSVVEPHMPEGGWFFSSRYPDDKEQVGKLSDLYFRAEPNYAGRYTVPVLWDTKTHTIVNNESADIIRMLNREFQAFTDVTYDFYPEDLKSEIDAVNDEVYESVNNGVYKAGFAETQAAYEEAYVALFESLDRLDARLGRTPFLVGERFTEADIRLFTTLVRFDAVYHNHFKCNRQKLSEFANLSSYLSRIYRIEGISETVNMDHIKTHYYTSHKQINPLGIVPAGPRLEFLE